MIVEVGVCTGLLAVGHFITNRFFGLSRTEQEEILSRSREIDARRAQVAAAEEQRVQEIDARRAAAAAAEEQRAVELQQAAEKQRVEEQTIQAFLNRIELQLQEESSAERLVPATFLQKLSERTKAKLRREIKKGTSLNIETKAYLALCRQSRNRRVP
jgi:hypothetical protein